jgi:NAD(P)-dependent dehydrogenase (short-subunit alcohol dehydrogenase family)
MPDRLLHRTALVTGSTSGIGQAIAAALAAQGAHVIVTGRSATRGAEVVGSIAAAGGRADFVAADLAQGGTAVRQLVERTTELAGGTVDILVNNAAYLIGGSATVDTGESMIDQALAVSVKAPFLLTAAIAPAMAERGSGAIVNVGSINGLVGMDGAALYGSTKAALHSMTKSWAAEFGPLGVRVNTVAPGPTLTERNRAILGHLEGLVATIPSRRLSTVDEVAAAVVFLVGDDAANIHGSTLSVDGGFTAV